MDIDLAMRGGESDPRNANLMRLFSYIGVGERAGSGLPKIIDGWTASGYPSPNYEESFDPDRTMLILPLAGDEMANVPVSATGRNHRQNKPADSMVPREAILGFLRESGPSSSFAIAEGIGLSPSRTRELLGEMTADELVEYSGFTRGRRYRVADEGRASAVNPPECAFATGEKDRRKQVLPRTCVLIER